MAPDDSGSERIAIADREVRYSERFLRDRARGTRRSLLFGGLGCLVAGVAIVRDSMVAYQSGELVTLGLRVLPRLPPFLAGPFGVLLVVTGAVLLRMLLLRRR